MHAAHERAIALLTLVAYHSAPLLLFRERGVEVQDEGINVRTQFRDDECNTMLHQAGNEVNIAREAIEFRDRNGTTRRPRLRQRRSQLRSTIERIASLARLDLDEFRRDIVTGLLGEMGERFALRINAET